MGRNLTSLYISSSFQFLTQVSGSELQDGLGNKITGSLEITSSKADTATSASFASTAVSSSYSTTALSASYAATATSSSVAINATSASYALTSTSASVANTATSASYATNALSSSYALTASFALNAGATVSTGSLMVTGSVNSNTLTFTKGDGSTFNLTVNTGSAVTTNTGSLLTTASAAGNVLTFTKGDASTFNVTVATGSGGTAFPFTGSAVITGSLTVTGSGTFSNKLSVTQSTNDDTNGVLNVYSTRMGADIIRMYEYGQQAYIKAPRANGQFFIETAGGVNDPVVINNSAVIYPGRIDITVPTIISSSLVITGSVASTTGFTGSLNGTASFAVTASYALNATPTNTGSLLTTASAAGNVLTFTKGDASTFNVTVATGSGGTAFPFTGSAQITGSLGVTGSINISGSVTGNILGNNTDTFTSSAAVQQVVTLTQTEYNGLTPNANTLYIISGSAPFTPGIYATTGSNTFIGNQTITGSITTTSTGSFASFVILSRVSASLNYVDDTAAAAGGVPVGGLYRNGNAIMIRLT